MSKEKEVEVQDRVSKFYEDVRYRNPHTLRYEKYWLSRLIPSHHQGLVLDNGCGVGILSELMDQKQMVGCDVSFQMLVRAKKRISKLINCDSEQLPFSSSSFDFIVCKSLLHHLADESKALQEMERVLKPSGELALSEPINNPINQIFRKAVSKGGHFSEQHHHYSPPKLVGMVKQNFKIAKIDFHGYLGYPVLGFPDIVNFYRCFPFKKGVTSALILFDKALSRIPVLKKLGWHMIIKARKP